MQKFSVEDTELIDLKLINTFYADDLRGYLTKDYEKEIFMQNGIELQLNECFYAKSTRGVIRGNHFQIIKPQKKLIRVVHGEIYDVVVDLRKGSSTFSKWQGFYLSEKSNKELFVPCGYAHGYIVLSEFSIVSYKCEGKFYSEYDNGIIWNDKTLNIRWPKVDKVMLSEKDKNLQTFEEYCKSENIFIYKE